MDDLPNDIVTQLFDYLQLEYGEVTNEVKSLKLNDLEYEGQHLVKGEQRHCWKYPTSKDDEWVTVSTLADGSIEISMESRTTGVPDKLYDYLYLFIDCAKPVKSKLPFNYDSEYNISEIEEQEYTLENGRIIKIYAEIALSSVPIQVSLSIELDGTELQITGSIGLQLNATLDSQISVLVEVGDFDYDDS